MPRVPIAAQLCENLLSFPHRFMLQIKKTCLGECRVVIIRMAFSDEATWRLTYLVITLVIGT